MIFSGRTIPLRNTGLTEQCIQHIIKWTRPGEQPALPVIKSTKKTAQIPEERMPVLRSAVGTYRLWSASGTRPVPFQTAQFCFLHFYNFPMGRICYEMCYRSTGLSMHCHTECHNPALNSVIGEQGWDSHARKADVNLQTAAFRMGADKNLKLL